ncbi:MAG: hypothetical protein ACI85O_001382 [Saprospiraceae bacterium]|jgi:hypothetical protein
MKRIFISLLLFIFLSLNASAQKHVAGEVLVRLTEKSSVSDFLADFNKVEKSLGELTLKKAVIAEWNLYLFAFDSRKSDASSASELLSVQKNVRYTSMNHIAEERGTVPNDAQYEEQWNLDKIEVEKVWDITTGGMTVDGREIVAMVLDGGFDVSHVEITENLWVNPGEIAGNGLDDDGNGFPDDIHGYNFREDTSIFTYVSNHGTAVAGILGAKGNNEQGMSGVNWDVKMMMCQAITDAQIYESNYYSLNARRLYNETNGAEGAFVVTSNASLGFNNDCDTSFPIWNELLDSTGLVGIMNVGATVNGNLNIDVAGDTPTSCSSDYIITVTNTDITDQKVSSAGYGLETIDIGAPAGNTSSTATFTLSPENGYRSNFGGCSAASPHVAGVIALLYALPCDLIGEMAETDPAGLALLMKRSIIEGAEPNSSLEGITVSGGRLNAYRSMLWWQSYCVNPSLERIDVDEYINNFVAETAFTNAYPNPADDLATFEYSIDEYGDFDIKVYDVLGRLIYKNSDTAEAFKKQSFTIITQDWAEGMYFVTIPNGKEPAVIPLLIIHQK